MLLPLEEYDESNISLDLDENDEGDQEVLLTSSDNASSFPPLPQEGTLISWWSNNFSLLEISGSCGDFGTLIPLLVALSRQRSIYLAPTLLGTGVVHIITGMYWDLPFPLQPMKSIAALAISQDLDRSQVTTAGIGMGILFLLLQFGTTIDILHRWIPNTVVGGLQLGVGWKLAIRGIHMIQELPWWGALDGIMWSVACGLLCLYLLRPRSTIASVEEQQHQFTAFSLIKQFSEKPPVGIYLFVLGVLLAAIQLIFSQDSTNQNDNTNTEKEPILVNALKSVTWGDWKMGLLQGTLPQLPLTTLNSCLSVCLLAQTLFPNRTRKATRRSVCLSIGCMNLFLCPLGMMPHCHGAGGLAGQHRLGANSGVSMVILGLFKIGLSLLAYQGSLLMILDALPVSILGVLLVLAGHELALTGVKTVTQKQDATNKDDSIMICLFTGLIIVGSGKTHVGALIGWITYMVYGNGYQELICQRRVDDSATSTG